MSETSIPQVALVATELRAIADALDTLTETPLTKLWVTLQIQPGGDDDDPQKVATIDAIGQAVLGEAGAVQVMSNGSYHHDVSGFVGVWTRFAVFSSVTSPEERDRLAELARLRAEIEELKARPSAITDDPNPDMPCCDHAMSSHYANGCKALEGCDCLMSEDEVRAAVWS